MARLTVLSLRPRRRASVSWLMCRQLPTGMQRKISAISTFAAGGSRAWVICRVSRAWLTPS